MPNNQCLDSCEIADRIRHRREHLKLSYAEVTRRSGIPTANIRNWESGTTPSAPALPCLARALETSIDWLITGHHANKALTV